MTTQNMTTLNLSESKIVSVLMLLAGVLLIVGMLFHPEITSHNPKAQQEEIIQMATINGVVHGLVIVLIWLLFAGSMLFYRLIHAPYFLKTLAATNYFLCTLTMTGAALMSGFITPGIVMSNMNVSVELFEVILSAGHQVNQTLAYMGNWCLMISEIFVALMLVRDKQLPKALSLMLFVAIVVLFALFSTEILRLNVFGTTILVVFWTGFIAIKAVWLWRFEPDKDSVQ